jgi:hypothetical protein
VSYLGETAEDVADRARAFVEDFLDGKDRDVARRLLLKQVSERHDSMSEAIRKVLGGLADPSVHDQA